jgi:hypothetical protein
MPAVSSTIIRRIGSGRRGVDRVALIRGVVRRAAADTRAASALVHRARAVLAARAAAGSDRVRLDGRMRTVDEVQALCAALATAFQGGPYPAPAARPLGFAGRGLVIVNAFALAVVLDGLDGAPPGPGTWVSASMAVVVSAVQVGLAFDLGLRLRAHVGCGARVPAPLAVEMGLLVALIGLVAAACDRWARSVGAGDFGVAAGLLLAGSAVAGPLMVLSGELYGPGAPARRLRRVERLLTRIDRRNHGLDRGGRRLLDAATHRLRHGEQLLVLVEDMLGDEDPTVLELRMRIDEVDAAIGVLWRDYTDAVPPLDPEDLDLVG